eukprot:1187860-Prorocentrum_minimum.AAC.1
MLSGKTGKILRLGMHAASILTGGGVRRGAGEKEREQSESESVPTDPLHLRLVGRHNLPVNSSGSLLAGGAQNSPRVLRRLAGVNGKVVRVEKLPVSLRVDGDVVGHRDAYHLVVPQRQKELRSSGHDY